jgi:hypothetical protein
MVSVDANPLPPQLDNNDRIKLTNNVYGTLEFLYVIFVDLAKPIGELARLEQFWLQFDLVNKQLNEGGFGIGASLCR